MSRELDLCIAAGQAFMFNMIEARHLYPKATWVQLARFVIIDEPIALVEEATPPPPPVQSRTDLEPTEK